GDLGPERREQPTLALLGRSVVEQRGGDDPESLRVVAARDLARRHLLEVDELLRHGRIAATELRWPAGHEPSGVELLALPRTRPVGEIRARPLPLLDELT